jgi:hypothetical protein
MAKRISGTVVIALPVLSIQVLTSQAPAPTAVQGQAPGGRGGAQGARGGAAAAQANPNGVTAGDFLIDPPTLINLGFEWFIQGDENRNAAVAVSYRKKGEVAWKDALPLLRLKGERVYQASQVDVIKAAGDGAAIFHGAGSYALFDVRAADYTYCEGLTFRNSEIAILAGTQFLIGSKGLSLIGLDLHRSPVLGGEGCMSG